MIIISIYVILSFLLDCIMSNFISINLVDPSYFRTIHTIISIVIIYNYFEFNKKYLTIIIILGALFDIVYTNTFLLNIILFLIIYFVLKELDYFLPNNLLTINIKSIVSIWLYHILSYLILLLVHYNVYTINLLGMILIRSIISTIIYTTISYLVLNKIIEKKDLKKIK